MTKVFTMLINRFPDEVLPEGYCLFPLHIMSIKNKYYLEIWIGLAKIKSDTKDILGDAIGAYVNVLGLSNNKNDFRKKVIRL